MPIILMLREKMNVNMTVQCTNTDPLLEHFNVLLNLLNIDMKTIII